MKPVTHSLFCDCPPCRRSLLTQLLALRDALTELSLALSDFQFELDETRRREAQSITRELIEQLNLSHGP